MRFSNPIAALLIVMCGISQAHSETLALGTYTADYKYSIATSQPNFIPLVGDSQNNRRSIVSFKMAKAGKIKITYTAECTIEIPSIQQLAWVDIDIILDGNLASPLPPTAGSSDGFCGVQLADGKMLSRSAITVVTAVSAGTHTVRIVGRVSATAAFTGGSAGLSQSTILIEN